MHRNTLLSALSLLGSVSSTLATPVNAHEDDRGQVQNANHIFNAIHSSMRQWGSSLNHNGMSFFLATVPAGTQLYHGTSKNESVKGPEWLALEPEHALIFARPRGGGPPGGGPPGGRPPGGRPPGDDNDREPGERGPEECEHGKGHGGRGKGKGEGKGKGKGKRPRPPKGHDGKRPDGKGRPPPPPFHHRPPPFDDPYYHRPLPPKGQHHDGPPFEHGPPPPDADFHFRGPHHGPPPPPPDENNPFHGPHHGPPPPPLHDADHPFHGPHHGPPPPAGHERPIPPPRQPHEPSHPHGPRPDHDESHPEHHRERPHHGPGPEPDCDGPRPPHKRSDRQQPLLNGPPSDPVKTGYLHTYVPKHDLKLLYLDGMSAGKTSNGTLDTQDILLLNLTSDGGVMGGEHARAQGLCSFSATIWEHKIDGVLRMEGGFEIILCEFEKHLETKEIMPVGGRFVPMNEWQYQKAITQRYHGIGGGRVVLDYSNFVTALEYEELDLWDNDVISDMSMPRLTKAAPKDLLKIKDAVTEMILQSSKTESSSDEKKKKVDWQAVADALVARYSAPLHYLHTDASIRSDRNAYVSYLSTLLRPFIDNTSRNHTLETSRCISQFVPTLPLPPANPPALAHQALYSVSQHLCSTLLAASDIATRALSRSLSTAPPAGRAVALVDGLRDYLQWTSWKECKACGDEEICVVPIWPMGSHEQHREPKCQGEDEARFEGGYWGRRGMGGPPGHGGPPGEGRPPREGKFGPVHGGGKKGKGRKHGGKCMKNKNQENQGVTSVRSKVSEARLALSGWFRAGGYWRASE